jgi:hypothetical protein
MPSHVLDDIFSIITPCYRNSKDEVAVVLALRSANGSNDIRCLDQIQLVYQFVTSIEVPSRL